MNNNFFGTTETGEISFNLDSFDNLYVGNLIITKRLSNGLIDRLIENKDKCILHLTVTGLGEKLEPLVPDKVKNFDKLALLLSKGFPLKQVVLRVDPIIVTKKGVETAISVIDYFCGGIKIPRVRISFLDMYKHVKERFNENNIPIPYNSFNPPQNMIDDAMLQLVHKKVLYGFELESCAENINDRWKGYIDTCGCVSQKDVNILGIQDKIQLIGIGDGKQRKQCQCPNNKKQIIKCKPNRCEHQCLYCYWKDEE